MDLDDLDNLLDMEEELMEEGAHKRSRADLQSQAEAAASLAVAGAPDGKRLRTEGPSTGRTVGPSQQTFNELSETEQERVLLALAADSQPRGGSVLAKAATTNAAAPPSSLLHESEEQLLLALAADTQPTHGRRPASRLAADGGCSRAAACQEEFVDDDAALEALFDQMYEPEPEAAGASGAGAQQQVAQQQAQGQADEQAAPGLAAARQHGQQPAADFLPRRLYIPPAREVFRIRGASVAVTSEEGERVYCQLQAPVPAGVARRLDMAGALRRARGGLLPESIASLLQAVERDQYERAVAETAAADARERATPGGERQRAGSGGTGCGGRAALWAEKYAPRGYIDLLSDEQINREVVRWLKGWDACVFGTATPAPPAPRSAGSRFQPHGTQRAAHGASNGAPDAFGRPEHKVILIAGPPGLGKTTLAHICAAHCGYRPVEINASDDRAAGALQSRILDAVEMQSVMGQRRPNCVIIDEIDGAAGGAEGRSGIAALLKIVKAAPGKASGSKRAEHGTQQQGGDGSGSDEEGEEGGSGGVGKGAGARGAGRRSAGDAAVGGGARHGVARQQLRPLMRPIICICNDLYAPALRPLRDVAKIFHFKKPQAERLAQRLQAICGEEGLRAEKSTLRLLVERTDCDIRSCLNTLQFLSKRQAAVRQADLAGLRVGQKDMTKGAFQVWAELLQKRKAPGIVGRAVESEAQRAQRLYDTLQDFGESDLVLGGVHENMLGLRYFDMALQRTTSALGSLGDADRFLRSCHSRGEFALLKYVPAPLVTLSGLVAGPNRPQLQWPRASFDCQRRLAGNLATLRSWMLGVSPPALAATSGRSMVLELLPLLMHILAPALRPVSQHLYSPQEMGVMRQLVDALLTYNLRFSLEPTPEEAEQEERQRQLVEATAGEQQPAGVRGALAEPPLRLRPAVHLACAFPGMAPKGRHLPAAVRQTVSHEADMEAIRRAEVARRARPDGSAAPPLGAAHQQQRGGAAPPAVSQPYVVPATLAERMRAAAGGAGAARAAGAARQARPRKGSWLDQLKEQKMARAGAAGAGGAAAGGKAKFPVLYKFHEGYTNAVKRPVLMRDLAR